jgi:inhibitor of the pro-sigma K processing machinery
MLALCAVFIAYLLYTRQVRWLGSVVRNMVLGVGAIFLANFALAGLGISVGVNIITAVVVGILGIPGFVLLYATQVLVH